MRVMTAKVVFAKTRGRKEIVLHQVNEVRVVSTFKEMTGLADITLPRKVRFFDKNNVKDVFRPGDPVVVSLGYDGQLKQEFSGYVASVSADIPILIRCQDEMWKVKRLPVNFSAASTTLEKLLKTICPGYAVDALEGVALGGVRFARTTVGQVLEKLRQDFGLFAYMDGKKLVCGKYYSRQTAQPSLTFNLERNVANNGLTYRNKEDIIVKIKAVSMMRNGRKIEAEIGEEGGDRLDLTYYNIEVKAELERMVKADYEKRKQDGFDGSITGFGAPTAFHGWKAKLTSVLYPDRNGTYFIEGVEKVFGEGGFRQNIKLGEKAV